MAIFSKMIEKERLSTNTDIKRRIIC